MILGTYFMSFLFACDSMAQTVIKSERKYVGVRGLGASRGGEDWVVESLRPDMTLIMCFSTCYYSDEA